MHYTKIHFEASFFLLFLLYSASHAIDTLFVASFSAPSAVFFFSSVLSTSAIAARLRPSSHFPKSPYPCTHLPTRPSPEHLVSAPPQLGIGPPGPAWKRSWERPEDREAAGRGLRWGSAPRNLKQGRAPRRLTR